MKITPPILLALVAGALMSAPDSASAGGKDPCKKADAKLARTGQGDTDGDGISDCREARTLRTFMNDADSDDDRMDDGEEMHRSCDPLNPDSDDDGIDDGDDPTPAVEQEVKALLDAISCPQPGVPGSIGALGISAALDDLTEFERAGCADLASLLNGGNQVLVEIEILEDVLGVLTATEVELRKPKLDRPHHDDDDDDDDDHDEDDDDEDDD